MKNVEKGFKVKSSVCVYVREFALAHTETLITRKVQNDSCIN